MAKFTSGHIPWNKGFLGIHINSDTEFKKGNIPWILGKKHSEESKKKMSSAHMGRPSPLRGIHLSKEHIKRISLSKIGKYSGDKSPLWRGGKSFELYTIDWTETLKRSIRERDHYTCQLCGKIQTDKTFPIHHIDYNKKNCNPENLITLCNSCHTKTNFNRNYWISLFRNK